MSAGLLAGFRVPVMMSLVYEVLKYSSIAPSKVGLHYLMLMMLMGLHSMFPRLVRLD
jgi:hypothetical protein